jgi:hypothetical protein
MIVAVYSFVGFQLDGDYVIAELTDDVRSWHIGAIVVLDGDVATLRRFDIQGDGANRTGVRELFAIAAWAKDQLGVRQLRIEGSARTSGAGPGRIPRPLVF